VHAKAFRDLEGDVCDLDRMGEISNNLIMNCSANEDGFHDLELATYAVFQLAKMLKEFRASYYRRWDNEAPPVMRRRRRSMRKRNRQRLGTAR
jgi:hypothetical protein